MDTIKINKQINKLCNITELLGLINEVNKVLYPNSNLIEMKHLGFYLNREKHEIININKFYKTFVIPKKNGSVRTICAPNKTLKHYQEILNTIFKSSFEPHKNVYGFIENKSVLQNANNHLNKKYVYNVDLKDFFSSFNKKWIYTYFCKNFNLHESKEKKAIALAIATLVTHKNVKLNDQVLPQGAPTSPILTNMMCYKLDVRLTGLAKRFGLNYSRYADDITFSSNHNKFKNEIIYVSGSTFDLELRRIITSYNLTVNENKVRLQVKGNRQLVTGVIVNEKANVTKKYIKELRQNIFFLENYGYEKANSLFKKKYIKDKDKIANIDSVLHGKLEYLKMIKGKDDNTYIKLKNRYNHAIGSRKNLSTYPDLNSLIDNILKLGINKAFNN